MVSIISGCIDWSFDCIDWLFDCGASNALLANCGNNTVIGAEPGAYTGISDKDCEDM